MLGNDGWDWWGTLWGVDGIDCGVVIYGLELVEYCGWCDILEFGPFRLLCGIDGVWCCWIYGLLWYLLLGDEWVVGTSLLCRGDDLDLSGGMLVTFLAKPRGPLWVSIMTGTGRPRGVVFVMDAPPL